MTKLSLETLSTLQSDVSTPSYTRGDLSAGIVHIGVGNFHRAHQAVYLDRLFESGVDQDWAIVGAGIKSFDGVMRDKLEAQDWLTTVVELDPHGLTARVTGAMIDFLEIGPEPLIRTISDPAIRIVSLTITEGGYFVDAKTGGFATEHPDVVKDAANPDAPETVFGILLAGLRARDAAGIPPFTIMSCDNLPENGRVAKLAVLGLAKLIGQDLADWVEANVAFPNGMVDCITPATSALERDKVSTHFGVQDAAPVVCEPFRQWVLEDHFSNGRPALEKVGVEFVDDVTPYELMKLRILNGGHAAIAYTSALLGYHFVHDAMADEDIRNWLFALEQREIISTVPPIDGVDFHGYLSSAASRFSNSAVADTIPRLCFDGSNRQPKFILPTAQAALDVGGPFEGLALEVALWCRYCAGSDDAGNVIDVKDAMAADLSKAALAAKDRPEAFLELDAVFGALGQNAAFAAAFADALRAIYRDGVRATLQAYTAKSA